MSFDLEKTVRRLADIEDIKQLKARYAAACDDDYNPDTLAPLFVENAIWDGSILGYAEGREGIREFFAAASTLMQIAEHVLAGELDAKAGRYDAAITALDRAVRLQDSLRYNEPPDWYFPVRHIQGALLLEAGRPAEAEVVYWEDLRRNPGNGYSLFGLQQSLLAQNDTGTAAEVQGRFEKAWAGADVSLTSSRY